MTFEQIERWLWVRRAYVGVAVFLLILISLYADARHQTLRSIKVREDELALFKSVIVKQQQQQQAFRERTDTEISALKQDISVLIDQLEQSGLKPRINSVPGATTPTTTTSKRTTSPSTTTTTRPSTTTTSTTTTTTTTSPPPPKSCPTVPLFGSCVPGT